MSLVQDAASAQHLHALLRESGKSLSALGPEPVAIACATDKFNDAGYDDFWCAVRVGPHFWEQSQFFAAPRVRDVGFATETARAPIDEGGQGTALLRQTSFETARTLLDGLERGGWRLLAEQAFGRRSDGPIFALVRQFHQLWLSISDPTGWSPGELYAVLDDRLVPVGAFDERMDELIGRPNLIPVHQIRQEGLLSLSRRAQRQFRPVSYLCAAAARALRHMLVAAAEAIRAETSEPVFVDLRSARLDERGASHSSRYQMGPIFQIRDVHYSAERRRHFETFPMDEEVRRRQLAGYTFTDFAKIEEGLRPLDRAHPRGLFELAFGVDTFGAEELLFAVIRDELYLLHANKLFSVSAELDAQGESGTSEAEPPIRFVGYARCYDLAFASSPWLQGFDPGDAKLLAPVETGPGRSRPVA